MSELKHTPGPWYWAEDRWHGGYSGLFQDGAGHGDADVVVPQCENDGDDGAAWFEEITPANARLIAAVPDLLKVCKTAYSLIISPSHVSIDTANEVALELKDAIAKAEDKS